MSSVVCSKIKDHFALCLDFKGEDFADKFGISALTSIHAAVVTSDLRNSSSQLAQPTVFASEGIQILRYSVADVKITSAPISSRTRSLLFES